jgi:hypothetical protein
MRWMTWTLAAAGCASEPAVEVVSFEEVGLVPPHPGTGGGDVGVSALLQGRSAWAFGDTFFVEPAHDGLTWRSATWLSTGDLDGTDGLDGFAFGMGDDDKPAQLLPHTAEELAFALANPGHRRTPWPGATAGDGERAVVLYSDMLTGDEGQWDFEAIGGSVAIWTDPHTPAERVLPPLFGADEPSWGAGALLHDGWLYALAYGPDGGDATVLARVQWGRETERAAWRFWGGAGWSASASALEPVFDGAPFVGLQHVPALELFVAVYMPPLSERIVLRTAPALQGPWSAAQPVGDGVPAEGDAWDYALVAHPELAPDDERVLVLSYNRPTGFLQLETRLVTLTLR